MSKAPPTTNNDIIFPFDCIVITCPDPKSADAARRGPLQELERSLNHHRRRNTTADASATTITIVATCDPFGARCGSGGGTLAALEALEVELLGKQQQHQREMETTAGPGGENNNHNYTDVLATKITLVLHAGGDSSRCPTQMILGKAWASLPIVQQQQQQQGSSSQQCLHNYNPTVLLIEQLAQLLQNQQGKNEPAWARPGTVVVAATDTLLQLVETHPQGQQGHAEGTTSTSSPNNNMETDDPLGAEEEEEEKGLDCAVIGVAVPAPLSTAKNHGVYVLQDEEIESSTDRLVSPLHVLQKPSLDVLRQDAMIHSVAVNDGGGDDDQAEIEEEEDEKAWIDTGIIILLPPARQALRKLADNLLAKCTTRGLTSAYQENQQQLQQSFENGDKRPTKKLKLDADGNIHDASSITSRTTTGPGSLTTFAQQSALKVDLYTDLLHSFSFGTPTTSKKITRSTTANPSSSSSLQQGLQDALGHLPLQILALPKGNFLHLGTTQEWVNFLVSNAGIRSDNSSSSQQRQRRRPFKLPCVNRHSCWTTGRVDDTISFSTGAIANDAILFNSILEPAKYLSIGRGSVVEHCLFPSTAVGGCCHYESITIGANCLLSGWRPAKNDTDVILNATTTTTAMNVATVASPVPSLTIPDNLCIQMISLKQSGKLVYMVVGMRDDMKKDPCDTLYNLPVDEVLATLLAESDPATEDSSIAPSTSSTMIWPYHATTRNIWYAKIHPILEAGTRFEDVFAWLLHRVGILQQSGGASNDEEYTTTSVSQRNAYDKQQVKKSLDRWRKLPRVSLHDLHGLADASLEWDFRASLTTYSAATRRQAFHDDWKAYWEMTAAATEAQNQRLDASSGLPIKDESSTIDWTWLLDLSRYDSNQADMELWTMLETLHQIVGKACLSLEYYPLCGRALMVASALVGELASPAIRDSSIVEGGVTTTTTTTTTASSELAKLKNGIDEALEALRRGEDEESGASEQEIHAWSSILHVIEQAIRHGTSRGFLGERGRTEILATCSEVYEKLSGCMTEKCVVGGRLRQIREQNNNTKESTSAGTLLDQWVISTAPARVDLSGGWSDTPPICFEGFGGAVTGVAVTVDRIKAVSCRCRIVPGQMGLLLRSEVRLGDRSNGDSSNGSTSVSSPLSPSSYQQVIVEDVATLSDFRDPMSDCALIKCGLILLGLLSHRDIQTNDSDKSLQPYINQFCGFSKDENCRLEVVSASLLPQGSGMGTSSILGGCILAAVAKAIGRVDMEDPEHLTYSVLILEQLLTSGGGYQDQVNGLIGGLKTVSSQPGKLPLEISIERKDIPHAVAKELDQRLVLAFTGKTRLAKNILQNVLRRWSRRTPAIVRTVQELVMCAQRAQEVLLNGDLGLLGACLNAYWKQKKLMAGTDSGVEPEIVQKVISGLRERQAIVGASLCGAGGGGFLVLLAAPGMNKKKIQDIVCRELAPQNPELALFTWHECQISQEGLTTQVLEGDMAIDTFDIAWHMNQGELGL